MCWFRQQLRSCSAMIGLLNMFCLWGQSMRLRCSAIRSQEFPFHGIPPSAHPMWQIAQAIDIAHYIDLYLCLCVGSTWCWQLVPQWFGLYDDRNFHSAHDYQNDVPMLSSDPFYLAIASKSNVVDNKYWIRERVRLIYFWIAKLLQSLKWAGRLSACWLSTSGWRCASVCCP